MNMNGDHTYSDSPVMAHFSDQAKFSIGKYCSVARDVEVFLGGEHHTDWISTYPFNVFSGKKGVDHPTTKGDVIIMNDVWIGTGVKILSGVTIGSGAVIGAYSVVAKNVEPYTIVAGNPVKIIRKRFSDDVIECLLNIRWWDWPEERINAAAPMLQSGSIKEFVALCS